MSELVQQRFQLAVIEAVAIQVGDQHADRGAPGEQADTADYESGCVTVLAIARKQIDVHTAQEHAGPAVDHFIVTHGRMPKRRLRRNEPDAVQAAGNREYPRNACVGREIRAQGLLIDVVARLLELLLIVRKVPTVQRHFLYALAQALGLERAQFADLPALDFSHLALDLVPKAVNRFRAFDHAPPRHEMAVARQPVQAPGFPVQTVRLAEQVQVLRLSAVLEPYVIPAVTRRDLR